MRKLWQAVALVLLLSSPRFAEADPLRIIAGGLFLDHEGEQLRLIGESFTITHSFSPVDVNYGLDIPKIWAGNCFAGDATCSVGDTLDVSFRTPGEVFLGVVNATIGARSYQDLELFGSLAFDVEATVLGPGPSGVGLITRVLPFTFSGTVRGLDGGAEAFIVPLIGTGIAGIPMYFDHGLQRYFDEEGYIGYTFRDAAPTPEPGTWLLIATGAVLAARRRRRR